MAPTRAVDRASRNSRMWGHGTAESGRSLPRASICLRRCNRTLVLHDLDAHSLAPCQYWTACRELSRLDCVVKERPTMTRTMPRGISATRHLALLAMVRARLTVRSFSGVLSVTGISPCVLILGEGSNSVDLFLSLHGKCPSLSEPSAEGGESLSPLDDELIPLASAAVGVRRCCMPRRIMRLVDWCAPARARKDS